MISDVGDRLYVWVWLPGEGEPVVAGVLTRSGTTFQGQEPLLFTYAASYRSRPAAVSLFPPELPLRSGTFDPTQPVARNRSPLAIHGCLRDGAPDAWGQRVINLMVAGNPDLDLSELTYLAISDSDRIGALDFQARSDEYVARGGPATLEQLLQAAQLIEAGQDIPAGLEAAAGHGTSIGGARPKALVSAGDRHFIAKFSSTTDARPVVRAEGLAMILAARVGLDVAPVRLHRVSGKDILLVERFDRPGGGTRRQMISALSILGLDEMAARYATYAELAQTIRSGPWSEPAATLRELFSRLVFNVCTGNTDDHLRNHSAFWDGQRLSLTPAYDLAPQPRSTRPATHAIGITADGQRASQLRLCRQVAPEFLLAAAEADQIIDQVLSTIEMSWLDACDAAGLTRAEAAILKGREFLNPYIFYENA
jgi:serine/threonine-protein kinase HipA